MPSRLRCSAILVHLPRCPACHGPDTKAGCCCSAPPLRSGRHAARGRVRRGQRAMRSHGRRARGRCWRCGRRRELFSEREDAAIGLTLKVLDPIDRAVIPSLALESAFELDTRPNTVSDMSWAQVTQCALVAVRGQSDTLADCRSPFGALQTRARFGPAI